MALSLAAGFFASFAVCNELPALAFAVAVFLLLVYWTPRPTLIFFLGAAAIPAIAFFATNYAAIGQLRPAYSEFGGPWYEYEGSYWRKPPIGQIRRGIDWAYTQESRGDYAVNLLDRPSRLVFADAAVAVGACRHDRQCVAIQQTPATHSAARVGKRKSRRALVSDAAYFGIKRRRDRFLRAQKQQLQRFFQWLTLADVAHAALAVMSVAMRRLAWQVEMGTRAGIYLSGDFRPVRQLFAVEPVAASLAL